MHQGAADLIDPVLHRTYSCVGSASEGMRAWLSMSQGTMQGWGPSRHTFGRGMQRIAKQWRELESQEHWTCRNTLLEPAPRNSGCPPAGVGNAVSTMYDYDIIPPVEDPWTLSPFHNVLCSSPNLSLPTAGPCVSSRIEIEVSQSSKYGTLSLPPETDPSTPDMPVNTSVFSAPDYVPV